MIRSSQTFVLVALLAVALLTAGCDSDFAGGVNTDAAGPRGSGPGGGNGMGVTPGGSQSFTYIRTLIESGQIPAPDAYLVESIYSEFDLPVSGPPSDQYLTVNSAHAWAAENGLPGAGLYQQLGFSSNIDPADYERPALNLSVVLDRSGSMGIQSSDGHKKMDVAKRAVHKLVDQLNEGDILSIVLFDDQLETLLEPGPVTNPELIHDKINSVIERGTTNMDIGMRQGYDYVTEYPEPGDREGRVILITDALPNTGNDSDVNFRGIVSAGAAEGVGLTAIGVGIDFDQDLIEFIATQEGGNYDYINTMEDANTLFSEDWQYMTDPFLYDFIASVTPASSCQLAAGFGFPGDDPSGTILEIETMFLSNERGAILLSFTPPSPTPPYITPDTPISEISISYRIPDGDTETDELSDTFTGPAMNAESEYYSQYGIHLGVVLTRMVLAMQEATELFAADWQDGEDPEAARQLLDRLADYIANHDAQLEDTDLSAEHALVLKLMENMGSRSD